MYLLGVHAAASEAGLASRCGAQAAGVAINGSGLAPNYATAGSRLAVLCEPARAAVRPEMTIFPSVVLPFHTLPLHTSAPAPWRSFPDPLSLGLATYLGLNPE